MSSSFKQILERDPELVANRAQLAKLTADTAPARLADLDQAIENARNDVGELVDALVAGGDVFEPTTVETLRTERERVALYVSALNSAIPKLTQKIQSRISDLAGPYAKSRVNEQLARVHKTMTAQLDLADVAIEEREMRSAAAAEGCPSHYFPAFAFPAKGGHLVGVFVTEKQHLEELFKKFSEMGFAPTAAHLKRLAALPD